MLRIGSVSHVLAALLLAGGLALTGFSHFQQTRNDGRGEPVGDISARVAENRPTESGLGLAGTVIWTVAATVFFVPVIVRNRQMMAENCNAKRSRHTNRGPRPRYRSKIGLASISDPLPIDTSKPYRGEICHVSREFFPAVQTPC